MKFFIQIVLIMNLFIFQNLRAETGYYTQLTSDYLARGISQTLGQPAVQASIEEYDILPQLLVGIWASNTYGLKSAETEVDLYFKYNLKLSDEWTVGLGGLFYYYTKSFIWHTFDYQLSIENPYLTFVYSYRPEFFGLSSSNTYYEISKKILINSKKKLNLAFNLGYATFSDEAIVGFKNHLNHRISFIKNIEKNLDLTFFYSNTNRRITDQSVINDLSINEIKAMDQTFGSSVSYVF